MHPASFRSPQFIVHAVILGLILIGNLLVIYLYFADRRLRKTVNMFIISLAFCDLLIALVFIPCRELFPHPIEEVVPFDITGYIASITTIGSLLNLAALTYDRFVAVFYSLRYHAIMTNNTVRVLMAGVWVTDLIVTLLPLSWKFVVSEEEDVVYLHIYQTILIIVVTIIHGLIIAVYVRIFKANRRHLGSQRKYTCHLRSIAVAGLRLTEPVQEAVPEKQVKCCCLPKHLGNVFIGRLHQSRALSVEMKAAKVVLLLFLLNTICWLPIVVLNTMYLVSWYRNQPQVPVLFQQISSYSFLAYSVVNPWIYALKKEDFRASFKRLVYSKLCRSSL